MRTEKQYNNNNKRSFAALGLVDERIVKRSRKVPSGGRPNKNKNKRSFAALGIVAERTVKRSRKAKAPSGGHRPKQKKRSFGELGIVDLRIVKRSRLENEDGLEIAPNDPLPLVDSDLAVDPPTMAEALGSEILEDDGEGDLSTTDNDSSSVTDESESASARPEPGESRRRSPRIAERRAREEAEQARVVAPRRSERIAALAPVSYVDQLR